MSWLRENFWVLATVFVILALILAVIGGGFIADSRNRECRAVCTEAGYTGYQREYGYCYCVNPVLIKEWE